MVTVTKSLVPLLTGLDFRVICGDSNQSPEKWCVNSITSDSREVEQGSLFVAIKGVESDGHNFIKQAIERGCSAIICEKESIKIEILKDAGVVVVEVLDTQSAYASIAACFYGKPAEKLFMIGVTGTNGKTTVTYLLEQVLIEAGLSVGVIGTINNRYTTADGFSKILPTRFTTPEARILQKTLREMVDAGVEYVVMEVSSHALAQSRVGNIRFDGAVFTNLTRDHLDYHRDMEDYFHAKSLMFSRFLKEKGFAVLPILPVGDEQDSWLKKIHTLCQKRSMHVVSWGEGERADIQLKNFSTTLKQTEIEVILPKGEFCIQSPLAGRFNIDNILTVVGICECMNIPTSTVVQSLSHATGAPGRLERVSGSTPDAQLPVVLVDFAHTPDALEKVLTTVSELPHRHLFCVFGCGGDRDSGKRAVMGEIAGKFCDVAVITDDNPRTENPEVIIAEIVTGLKRTKMELRREGWLFQKKDNECGGLVIRDRKKAIESTIKTAKPEDIVVIAGKGHEPYQLTSQGKRFFDDRLVASSVLCSWTVDLITEAVGGKCSKDFHKGELLGTVSTDSRVAGERTVFIALRGENHDAHEFGVQAVENGACCLIVEHEVKLPQGSQVSQIVVADTLKALGDLAAFRRKMIGAKSKLQIIGITGSCGKTTVKEMVASIFEKMYPAGSDHPDNCILKTQGNFNNLIGLPLSLLPLDVQHKVAVLEMGMNQPGELQRLGEISDPDISCIVNVHGAHLEGLHSIEGVARAKEELFASTKKTGTLVVNLDDARVFALAEKYTHKKVTYTTSPDNKISADLWISDICLAGNGTSFRLNTHEEKTNILLQIPGEHNVSNALAAAAITMAAGACLQDISMGLAECQPHDKRMEIMTTEAGYRVINDTYNANPASMAAGLKTLKQMAGRTSVAIIGDMLELGESSNDAHSSIGELLAELVVDYVGVVGDFKEDVLKGAVSKGFNEKNIRVFEDKEHAVDWMKKLAGRKMFGQDDVVLIKASRGLRFETIVERLMD